MKPIVIYLSKTGFTERYAEWLSEALNCPMIPYEKCKSVDLSSYDTILYGGGIHAGMIQGIKWFKQQIPSLEGKKLVVFATGASPAGLSATAESLKQNFTAEENALVKVFYLEGGLNYDKMSAPNRMLMKMMSKMLSSKKNKTEEERGMANAISTSFDHCKKENIQGILDFINS